MIQARSRGEGAGVRRTTPNLPKGPLFATKLAKNGVLWGGGDYVQKVYFLSQSGLKNGVLWGVLGPKGVPHPLKSSLATGLKWYVFLRWCSTFEDLFGSPSRRLYNKECTCTSPLWSALPTHRCLVFLAWGKLSFYVLFINNSHKKVIAFSGMLRSIATFIHPVCIIC